MSSMFKKRGGLAFKPKVPSARPRRPTRQAASPQETKTTDSQIGHEAPPDENRPEETQIPESEAVSDDTVCSRPANPPPSEAGQALPTPVSDPRQPALSETPSTDALPKSTEEASIKTPTVNRKATNESEDTARGTKKTRPDPTPHVPEPQPPTTYTSTEANPDESSNTAEEIPTANEPAVVTGQEATLASNKTPTTAPEAPAPKTRAKRPSAPRAKKNTDTDTADARPKKRQRRFSQTENEGTESESTTRRRRATGNSEARSRRARSMTPEDAESQVVDLQKLKMSDLTRDLHIGKKFSRHDELRERERQKRLKARLQQDGEQAEDEENEDGNQMPGRSNGTDQAAPSGSSGAAAGATSSGPQFRIVDGQIVVDQTSLVMDRHARAVATQGDMETIEENDFTRLITSSSFMNTSKLKGPNIWTPAETELFYRGLQMFGTEFTMITAMFPSKQRRHIKLKFNREERHNPQLVDAALTGKKTIKMDIDEYKALTGTELETVESIEAEQHRRQEEYEAAEQRKADEKAEAMRKKREELFADDDKDGAEDSAGKKKKKGKKGKNANPNQYGEIVAVE